MSGATLDEQVAVLTDLMESDEVTPVQAVVLLQDATGLCPRLAVGLLRAEVRRRRDRAVGEVLGDMVGTAREAVLELSRADDGTWSP